MVAHSFNDCQFGLDDKQGSHVFCESNDLDGIFLDQIIRNAVDVTIRFPFRLS
jgi:hypothetical protein